jgi:CRP-like cAMP-binding protein
VSDVETFSLAHWNFRPFLQEPDVLQAVITLLCRRLRQAEADSSQ